METAIQAPEIEMVPADVLTRLEQSVGYARSTDDKRPHISRVHFERDGEYVVAVATDGHRMAIAREQCEGQVFSPSGFPDWRHVVPECADEPWSIEKAKDSPLAKFCEMVAGSKRKVGQAVPVIRLAFSTHGCRAFWHPTPEITASCLVPARIGAWKGKLGIDARYLLDVLKRASWLDITITDPLKAVRFDAGSDSAIIMPVHL